MAEMINANEQKADPGKLLREDECLCGVYHFVRILGGNQIENIAKNKQYAEEISKVLGEYCKKDKKLSCICEVFGEERVQLRRLEDFSFLLMAEHIFKDIRKGFSAMLEIATKTESVSEDSLKKLEKLGEKISDYNAKFSTASKKTPEWKEFWSEGLQASAAGLLAGIRFCYEAPVPPLALADLNIEEAWLHLLRGELRVDAGNSKIGKRGV